MAKGKLSNEQKGHNDPTKIAPHSLCILKCSIYWHRSKYRSPFCTIHSYFIQSKIFLDVSKMVKDCVKWQLEEKVLSNGLSSQIYQKKRSCLWLVKFFVLSYSFLVSEESKSICYKVILNFPTSFMVETWTMFSIKTVLVECGVKWLCRYRQEITIFRRFYRPLLWTPRYYWCTRTFD